MSLLMRADSIKNSMRASSQGEVIKILRHFVPQDDI